MSRHWSSVVPLLCDLEPESKQLLMEETRERTYRAGSRLLSVEESVAHYLLLLSGSVCVRKASESGREMLLYRLKPGESCVLSAIHLSQQGLVDAEVVAETEVHAANIPGPTYQKLMARSEAFRGFVLAAYAARLSKMMSLVGSVAFERLDSRLARSLLRSARDNRVKTTHEELACELGTAREVVSRQLKTFERQGWVRLGRGWVELLLPASLEQLATCSS